jgi:hypothetical protein
MLQFLDSFCGEASKLLAYSLVTSVATVPSVRDQCYSVKER